MGFPCKCGSGLRSGAEFDESVEVLLICDRVGANGPKRRDLRRERKVDVERTDQFLRETDVLAHQLHREARIELAVGDPRGEAVFGHETATGSRIDSLEQLL